MASSRRALSAHLRRGGDTRHRPVGPLCATLSYMPVAAQAGRNLHPTLNSSTGRRPYYLVEAIALVSTAGRSIDDDYAQHFRDLARLCRALGAGPDSEDVAQETILYARVHANDLRDPSLLTPWLRQIARRAVVRRLKKRSTEVRRDVVFAPTDVAAGIDLAQAIGRLPLRERQTIGLVYGLGYSQGEAADVLGIARGTVAATLFHAKRHLADMIETGRRDG